jgi:hypothetical protein
VTPFVALFDRGQASFFREQVGEHGVQIAEAWALRGEAIALKYGSD